MFDIVKQNVNILEVLEKDLNVTFRQEGERNWRIDGDEVESCPFCNHHDCFKVNYIEGQNESAFYKCFSCDEAGDVITWRSKHKNLSMKDAALELAREYDIKLPTTSPIQQVFTLAALYYQTCFKETCNKPFAELGGKTPKQYQVEVRCHDESILEAFQIGFSDGGLISYLEGLGIDEEIIAQSGLRNKAGKDFLPARCFIYPHFVKGRVSHFTFKDPLKKLAYQLKKKDSLNGYLFYGQDSISKSTDVVIVEGENDLLSLMETGQVQSVIATIGQLSKEQMDWMRENLASKRLITIFDPDEAGDKYREKIEALRRCFVDLMHVLPPNGKDIDEHLREGADLETLVKKNLITVKPPEPAVRHINKVPVAIPSFGALQVPWETVEQPTVAPVASSGGYVPPAGLSVLDAPSPVVNKSNQSTAVTETEEPESTEDGSVIQRYGCYWKVKYNKDGLPDYVRISDFTIELKNVFLDEGGDRNREVILVRRDGYRSKPFFINSEAKVSLKTFTILVARWGECEWLGREQELAGMWRLVLLKSPGATINVPRRVGRHAGNKGWVFKNVFITDDGRAIKPDEDGVFWIEDKKVGVRPQGLSETEDPDDKNIGIPELEIGMSKEETSDLLGGFLEKFALNLGDTGVAIMTAAWMWANVYSDAIFKLNGGMCMLMFWGPHGDGKTTLAQWMHYLFGFSGGHGYTQTSQLKSAVGWMRQAEYYSSLPMILDEVRNDENTIPHLPMIRSWYDRSGRVMGVKDSFGVQTRKIRSNLFLAGEDLPEDPATKERCVILRVNKYGRERLVSYQWIQEHKLQLSAIGYRWILDSHKESMEEIIAGIREVDKELMASGCSSRISKNWAAIGYFAKRLGDKYFPEFDLMGFIKKASTEEHAQQAKDSTLMQFFDLVAIAMAQEHPKITSKHVMKDGNELHIWFSAVYKEVMDQVRGANKFTFSKNMLIRSIKDEPWYLSDNRKITMGLDGIRRTVITLNWTTAPEAIKALAGEA